jgi:hypothetical protein
LYRPHPALARRSEAVEGVELHLVVLLSGMQGVEVGNAVDAEHHGLTVDHELGFADLPGGLDKV